MGFESLLGREKAGLVLLHPTSLPDPEGRSYGIGELGSSAKVFIEHLQATDTLVWQVLPLGHTGFKDSPYQTFSRLAGSPLMISVEYLHRDGDLCDEEHQAYCEAASGLDPSRVDYGWIFENKLGSGPNAEDAVLRRAFKRFCQRDAMDSRVRDFYAFVATHRRLDGRGWLADYSDYMGIKENHALKSWNEWPDEFRDIEHWRHHREDLLREYPEIENAIAYYEYLQFVFYSQWNELREKLRECGRMVVGDMPWYVGYDSADVWANRAVFQLDDAGARKAVAGVPPDAFSETGQLWGNPLYDWNEPMTMAWWAESVGQILSNVDILRLDHFRAIDTYWSIPWEWVEENQNALGGHWEKTPARELLEAIKSELERSDIIAPDQPLPIIAEDLGNLDPIYADREKYPETVEDKNRFEVDAAFAEWIESGDESLGDALNRETGEYNARQAIDILLEDYGLPWMGVLQFAFQGADKYMPDQMPRESVTYTGTHDNDTTVGWFYEQSALEAEEHKRREAEREEQKRHEAEREKDDCENNGQHNHQEEEKKPPLHERIHRALRGDNAGDTPEDAGEIAREMVEIAMRTDSVLAGCPMQDLLALGGEARMNKPGDNEGQWWAWRMTREQAWDKLHWEKLIEWNRVGERLAKHFEI